MESQQLRGARQQVSSRLYIRSDGVAAFGIAHAESDFHDEKVGIVVAKDGVPVVGVVQIISLERGTNPRHIHVVQVEQVKAETPVLRGFRPTVTPSGREDTPMELGAVLKVIAQRQLRSCTTSSTERLRKHRSHKTRECKLRLHAIFLVVLVLIALQAGNGLESRTQLNAQHLGAMKQVAVLVSQRSSRSQVASRVGALGLERQCRRLVHAQLNVAIQQLRIGNFRESDVGEFHRLQPGEVVVCLLQVSTTERSVLPDGRIQLKHFPAQMDLLVGGW